MEGIDGASSLTAIFGRWPTFHDAAVLRFQLSRGGPDEVGPSIEADVHVFEMTPEVAPSGHYVLRHHTLVTLRFGGMESLELAGFNNQNALMRLDIEDIRGQQLEGLNYRVSFDPAFGLSAGFLCRTIKVLGARPWDPASRQLAV